MMAGPTPKHSAYLRDRKFRTSQTHARTHSVDQCCKVSRAARDRACLYAPEEPLREFHPHHRLGPRADQTGVGHAFAQIGEQLTKVRVVMTKLTLSVGTGDEVERILPNSGSEHGFAVVPNPEFLRESAVKSPTMKTLLISNMGGYLAPLRLSRNFVARPNPEEDRSFSIRVALISLGYARWESGARLAKLGYDVVCLAKYREKFDLRRTIFVF